MKKISKITPISGKRMDEPIVFFGTGPVAARSLELLAKDFEIEAVLTKPRPEHHKGDFPVLNVAETLGLKVITANNKAELTDVFASRPVKSRLGVVIDYGIIISRDVIDYFPLGIVNSHFSLLPRWRGADPISFAILSGEAETGVSIMLIDEALDEGPLLAQKSLPLDDTITTPELTDRLITLSHELLVQALPAYTSGQLKPYPQTGEPTYSRKLTKEDGVLDFNKPAADLEREVRAYAGWPRSRAKIGGTDVIITKAHVAEGTKTSAGEVVVDGKQLAWQTSHGLLVIDSLIPAGKKEMTAEAFLAGYRLP